MAVWMLAGGSLVAGELLLGLLLGVFLEKDLSASQSTQKENARLPQEDENTPREEDPKQKTSQGKKTACRLTVRPHEENR